MLQVAALLAVLLLPVVNEMVLSQLSRGGMK